VTDPFRKERLYEALDFFSRNVKYAGKVKLFKLLFYLDLLVFRRTGRTVTGLTYQAWPKGPVPAELDNEFKDPHSELHQRFEIKDGQRRMDQTYLEVTIDTDEFALQEAHATTTTTYIPTSIRCRHPLELQHLNRREQRIARLLAEIFYDALADDMSDVSHGKSGPWMKAKTRGRKEGIDRPEIDLMVGVVAVGDSKEELPLDELRELVEERKKLHQALG
jgi:uncharacterized phage-associated protein